MPQDVPVRRRREKAGLPVTKFKAMGHRSHVAGIRRFLSGRKKSWIADMLHRDAAAIMRRLQERRT